MMLLQVGQCRWSAEVVDEIAVLEEMYFVEAVAGRPARWTRQ